jgi:histidinol-phosphate aminotransferase
MAEHGLDDALKLASNESALGPLPEAAAAAVEATAHANRYADHLATALRTRLGAHLGVDADRVAVGCGSVGLLHQLAVAYLEPGTAAAYGWPSFETYPIVSRMQGATPVAVPNRQHTIDARALADAAHPTWRLVLLANPNTPPGTAVRTADLLALADAVDPSTLLVVDEAYREFVTDPEVPDAIALLGDRPNVCVLRTFSKAYGLAALRVGYLVGPPEVVAAVDRVLPPFAVNGPGQAAAIASLDHRDAAMARVAEVVAERDRLARALRERGIDVPDAQANFVWLPVGDDAGPLAQALERHGVVTRPFAGFGVRVTATNRAEGDRFLAAFDAVRAS